MVRENLFGLEEIGTHPYQRPLAGVVVDLALAEGREVEGADLRDARHDVGREGIDVLGAAAGHEEELRVLLGEQQGAGDVARVAHVLDNGALVGEGAGRGVVVPAEDPIGRGGV